MKIQKEMKKISFMVQIYQMVAILLKIKQLKPHKKIVKGKIFENVEEEVNLKDINKNNENNNYWTLKLNLYNKNF